jgi:type I restriction enzyme S subunit
MTVATLLRQFERVILAPYAVPHLRRLVHRLAVGGSLLTDGQSADSVVDLVAQLHSARRASLSPARKRKPLESLDVNHASAPFIVPPNWAWLRLHEVGTLSGGMTPSKSQADFWDGDIPWLSPKDIKADEVRDSGLKITALGATATGLQIYPPGCLFIVARSGILKRALPVAINRVPATANQDMKVLRPFVSGLERYLQIMFKGMSDFILSELVKTGTTVQSLRYEEFERQPVPIPPLEEQHRIVAKVDELMSLCDELEAAQTEREARRDRLRTTSLQNLVAPDEKDSARFFLQNSRRMITKPEHVSGVRQVIFKLALTGRLLRESEAHNDAGQLLVAAAAARLQATDWRQRNPVTPSPATVARFALPDLPDSWRWARLDEIADVVCGVTKDGSKQGRAGYVEVPYLRVANVQRGYLDLKSMATIRVSRDTCEYLRLREGDILFNEGGDRDKLGRGWVWEGQINPCIHQNHVYRARLFAPIIDPRLVSWHGNTFGQQWFIEGGKQTTNLASLNKTTLRSFPVPIPPLAEQRRIVATVEELMAICDELEHSLAAEQTERGRLLEALLHAALEDGCQRDGDDNGCRDGQPESVGRAASLDQSEQSRPACGDQHNRTSR